MADSGDSSPLSAAATDDVHHDATHATANPSDAAPPPAAPSSLPPPPPAKVRLMVSYGGRIQPRPHDNQLSYVNGETKILSIERPLRFPDFAARLAALAGARADLCVKYQLPGEDLDALVSVTNDEDLDHLVIEYDRLHLFRNAAAPGSGGGGSSRGGGGSTPRLRVFLFPVVVQAPLPPPPSPPRVVEPKQDQREWYLDLRPVSPTPQQQQQQKTQETVHVQSPPPLALPVAAVPQSVMLQSQKNLELLYALDYPFVPPPAVKVKDPAGEPPMIRENFPVEIPPKTEDRLPNPNAAPDNNAMVAPPAVSPSEFHRQIQEKLQLADNATQQPPQVPAPVAAQQAPPAPAPVAQQQPPPAPAPVATQQSPPAPAPAPPTPAAQVTVPLPRNGSDDSLTRAYPPANASTTAPPEYYLPKFPEKPQAAPQSTAPPAAAFLPVPGRYASVAPGAGADHGPFFFIPAPPPHHHGYYTSTNPAGTSYYAVAPHNGNGNGNGNGGTAPAPTMSNAQAYPQVAYDSNGRAVYYTGLLPQYPSAVNGMSSAAAVLGSEPSKPVAVKPTVS